MGFRYRVGIDTISYMNAYRNMSTADSLFSLSTYTSTRFEPGFVIICHICKFFTNSFWPVQMIMSIITTGSVFIFLYRHCTNVFVGVALFLLLQWIYFSTEIMRESAAVGIFLLNYKNIEEKKWLKYYFFTIFSILFHYSAIIIWFVPFVKLLEYKWLFYSLCVCFILITPLVEELNKYIQIAAITGRIDQYVATADDLNINWRIGELIRTAFPACATLLGFQLFKLQAPFKNILLAQILFCMGAFAIPLIFSRFANYTTVFVTVAAANFLCLKQVNPILKTLFTTAIILSQVIYYVKMYQRWIPYTSIFYPEELPIRSELYRHFFLQWLRFIR